MLNMLSPTLLMTLAAIAGVVASCMVSVPVAYYAGKRNGDESGYARYAAEQSLADLEAEKERKKFDAKIQAMSPYDFCVDALTRRELPIDSCEELRRISTK